MSVTAAQGFVASGMHSGIKRKRHDLALLATDDRKPVKAAAVFTQNRFVAPPVVISRQRLAASGGLAAAVIVNSGNANAGTGRQGLEDAETMCAATARAAMVPEGSVLVCSTGIIGTPLPMDRIVPSIPELANSLSPAGAGDAARGILTTDSHPKEVRIEGSSFTLGGMAKGCGMLAPNMATMLAFLTTDADIETEQMRSILRDAVDRSFNCLNVDGATSTNDSVMLLASGRRGSADPEEFADALHRACEDLTLQMARDAEGVTRLVKLEVAGAANDAEARMVAKAVAENNLVKCSWHGGDPYWGRLLAAAGAAGAAFDPERSCVLYGGIKVAEAGAPVRHDEAAVAVHMQGSDLSVRIELGLGTGTAQTIGIDLSPAYIEENSRTS